MMKRKLLTKMVTCVFAVAFVLIGMTPAFAAKKLFKLTACQMPEFETFFPWYAHQKGWFKAAGIDFHMLYFNSGMAELQALPAGQWQVGEIGGVPHIYGALRYGALCVGLGDQEAWANAVFVRPNSPILKVKGWNKKYPNVYGSPSSVKGKTMLVTTISSAHYAMSSWLHVFGLKDKDVVIKNMDQSSIVAAFKAGIGNTACLWAPYIWTAINNGWKEVANVHDCHRGLPITFIVDKKFAAQHPQIVVKWMAIMFRAIDKIAKEGATPENIALYKRFYKDWAGIDYTNEDVKRDIQIHPVFTLQQQLKMFSTANGESNVQRQERLIAEFLRVNGKLTDAQYKEVASGNWITDKYLKMVAAQFPALK